MFHIMEGTEEGWSVVSRACYASAAMYCHHCVVKFENNLTDVILNILIPGRIATSRISILSGKTIKK